MKLFAFCLYKYLLTPLLFLLLQFLRPFSKGKLRELIEDKNKGFAKENRPHIGALSPIWIHAASGEIEYARSLIRELKKQNPEVPILVTYSSPSAKKILAGLEIDAWTALPWDFDFVWALFLKKWNPRILLVSRTDLWPVMAANVHKNKIPAYLFSATFAANSSRLRGMTRFLTAHSLEKLDKIFCVSEEDVQNLKVLNLRTPVEVLGDTRFDQVVHRLQNPKPIKTELRPETFTFIMGSTWPEDEAVLVPAMAELSALPIRFIVAPHETTASHLQNLEAAFTRANLRFCRYSQMASWTDEKILLIDQVGILAELYTWAHVAFVGGSFRRQVHSVMEPLAAGLPVLVGPFHHNNREALAYQKKIVAGIPLVTTVSNAAEISRFIKDLSQQDSQILKAKIEMEVLNGQGATQKLLAELKTSLYESRGLNLE